MMRVKTCSSLWGIQNIFMSLIYWEKQGVDRLCAVHSVNSLLQGPFFSEVSLAQIALELDKKEQALMLEQGMTKQAVEFMKQESGNVAMDGYYSVQVITEALKTLQLEMVSLGVIKGGEDMAAKQGFICNSDSHWFSLRRIDKAWYNLNSTNRRMPEIISDFYLSAFLHAVRDSGYQIFSVEGHFPESGEGSFEHYNKNQLWFPPKRVQKYHEKCIKRKGFKPNISGAGTDHQMEEAIARSLGQKYEKYISSGEDSDWEGQGPKDEKKEMQPFGGQGSMIGEEVDVNYQKFQYPPEEIEMLTFMQQSLQEQYSMALEVGRAVTIRHSSGKKETRVFPAEALVEAVYDYVWSQKPAGQRFYLVNADNKQRLVDVFIPIFALEDEDGDVAVIVSDL